jgi:hypothetical protein
MQLCDLWLKNAIPAAIRLSGCDSSPKHYIGISQNHGAPQRWTSCATPYKSVDKSPNLTSYETPFPSSSRTPSPSLFPYRGGKDSWCCPRHHRPSCETWAAAPIPRNPTPPLPALGIGTISEGNGQSRSIKRQAVRSSKKPAPVVNPWVLRLPVFWHKATLHMVLRSRITAFSAKIAFFLNYFFDLKMMNLLRFLSKSLISIGLVLFWPKCRTEAPFLRLW